MRWRGAYGISGNRGASAFTNSSRSWPRVRSRLAAGVPSASGLRRADQIPGSGFEVAAAAHVNSVNNPKKRIMQSAAVPSWQEIFGWALRDGYLCRCFAGWFSGLTAHCVASLAVGHHFVV